MTYHLYQTLSTNIPKRDLTISQKNYIINSIQNLSSEQKTAFLRLILEYSKIKESEDICNIPYDGEEDTEGIHFDIGDFPRELRWILWRFIHRCNQEF